MDSQEHHSHQGLTTIKEWFTISCGVRPSQVLREIASAVDKPRDDRRHCASKPLGPYCIVTEEEARKAFVASGLIELEAQDRMLLLTKLGLALVGFGVDTIDTCAMMKEAALSLGITNFQASFDKENRMSIGLGFGHLHFLPCAFGLAPAKGPAVCAIGHAAAHCALSEGSVSAALALLDNVIEMGPPYGKAWHMLAEWCTLAMAPVAVFGGNWDDCVQVMALNTMGMAIQQLSAFSQTAKDLMPFMLTFYAGAVGSLKLQWFRTSPLARCHSIPVMMSCIFNLLPGSSFLYGALEIAGGHPMLGATRISGCLVKIFILSAGILIGWQVNGYDDLDQIGRFPVSGTTSASIPPFVSCSSDYDWTTVYCVVGLPYMVCFCVYLGIAPRDLPMHVVGLYGVWVLYGYLASGVAPALPGIVFNSIIMFVAMTFACFAEIVGYMSAGAFRVCLLQSFSPSTTAIKAIYNNLALTPLRGSAAIPSIQEYLAAIAVGYAIGDSLACTFWRDVMKIKHVSIVKPLKAMGFTMTPKNVLRTRMKSLTFAHAHSFAHRNWL